ILKARVRELDLQFRAERFVNRAQAEVTRKELDEAQAELDRAQDRFRHLVATSAAAGVLVVEQSEDMPERFFRQGAILGYVTPPAGSIVRVVVSQDDIDLVREKLIRVTVRMPGQSGAAVPAEILREVPAAYDKLPSKALTSSGGGAIAVDPRDAEGLNSLRRWFQFDLKISADALPPAFGSRVYVRFELEWEPVGLQMARRVRQLFLSQFHA
ncbi:HlyD family efflux transporter periplasmic adaptor subunit, partial [Mesorhizobium sp. M7A.F.Ca.CA.001.04.1.1]